MDLVAGGAGFIGSHLVDALLADDRPVRVLDALVKRPTDDGSRQRRAVERWAGRVDVREVDVRDPAGVRSALIGVTRVFHLAHATGSRNSVLDPIGTLRTNVEGTQVLLDGMERAGTPFLVLASSAQVYGSSLERASRETDLPAPGNPFGASMVAAEALVHAWQAMTRNTAVIVRCTSVYGPRIRPDSVVRRALEAVDAGHGLTLFGTGRSRRDYLHVEDAVRLLLAARPPASHPGIATFNASTGVATRTLDLVQQVSALTGRRANIECLPTPTGDPECIWADPSYTTSALGLTAQVALPEGLAQTLAWLRKR